MYKKIRSHPSVYKIYGNKLVNENSITQELLNQNVKSFKDLLDEQYKSAKDYNPKIEWFEGTWSRYKPERGKDKRGVTGPLHLFYLYLFQVYILTKFLQTILF